MNLSEVCHFTARFSSKSLNIEPEKLQQLQEIADSLDCCDCSFNETLICLRNKVQKLDPNLTVDYLIPGGEIHLVIPPRLATKAFCQKTGESLGSEFVYLPFINFTSREGFEKMKPVNSLPM